MKLSFVPAFSPTSPRSPPLNRALPRVCLAFTAFFEVQALKNKQQLANQY